MGAGETPEHYVMLREQCVQEKGEVDYFKYCWKRSKVRSEKYYGTINGL